ncbi:MAG TPA: ACP S-malonyltransferase [Sporichthyaceae bacterium]
MDLVLAIVAPGQGAQTPGFLAPWLELPTFATRLEWLSTVSGLDLVTLGTKGDADEIKDTAVAQPLLVAAGLAVLGELLPHGGTAGVATAVGPVVGCLAGHSVGELTAAAAAGVLSAEQAMVLVRERGRAMAAASANTPTGMTAVLGGDREAVLAKLAQHGLTAANDNGAGQLVAAGTLEQLAALAEDGPEKARLIPLSVAGAFHTKHMSPAVNHLADLSASITPGQPSTRLLSNADGAVVTSGTEFLTRLVNQVSNPVRWDLCMATMMELGVTGLIELLPGGTLTGLAKRGMRGVTGVALKTPDDLDAARGLLAEGAQS